MHCKVPAILLASAVLAFTATAFAKPDNAQNSHATTASDDESHSQSRLPHGNGNGSIASGLEADNASVKAQGNANGKGNGNASAAATAHGTQNNAADNADNGQGHGVVGPIVIGPDNSDHGNGNGNANGVAHQNDNAVGHGIITPEPSDGEGGETENTGGVGSSDEGLPVVSNPGSTTMGNGGNNTSGSNVTPGGAGSDSTRSVPDSGSSILLLGAVVVGLTTFRVLSNRRV